MNQATFYDRLEELEQLLAQTPTEAVITRFSELTKDRSLNDYAFMHLDDPRWLEPLRAKGIFYTPPKPQVKDNETIYPKWPPSLYLARMAIHLPIIVHDIILAIPYTENILVNATLADAVLAMPPYLARDFILISKAWLKAANPIMLGETLGQLVVKLAQGNQFTDAFDLCRSLLAISLEPLSVPTGDIRYRTRREAHSQFSEWEYERLLKQCVPLLIDLAPVDTLRMLCDLLESAAIASLPENVNDTGQGFSYVWRPAIEDSSQNPTLTRSYMDLLITAVRDTADVITNTGAKSALDIIGDYNLGIFKRIELYLLNKHPKINPDKVACLLTNSSLYENKELHHEYYWLLSNKFGTLNPDLKEVYLGWINQGPNIESWSTVQFEYTGNETSQSEKDGYLHYWQFEKLWPVRSYLQGEWFELFEDLRSIYHKPEHPDFLAYEDEMQQGPTSPVSAVKLGEMSIDELIVFLGTPLQVGHRSMQSMEGIGRELQNAVTVDPNRFALAATRFEAQNPTYVRSLIEGLAPAFAQNKTKEWLPVLELCQWVITQEREIPNRQANNLDEDPDWGQTRLAIARLLSTVFSQSENELPYEYRQKVWSILEVLTNDPEPSPEYEKRYGGSNMGPATLSINTVRGTAMHAVIRYALWIRKNILYGSKGDVQVTVDFSVMPEVKTVLDQHLKQEQDSSLAVRAVYGQWFPWLMALDENWAKQSIPGIFPKDDLQCNLWYSAWDTYVTYCRAYDNVFYLLRDEYMRAIECIAISRSTASDFGNPDVKLSHHLMTLYWRGTLELAESSGLLMHFYNKANGNLRAHALAFIGRTLQGLKTEVSKDVKARLIDLWMWRLSLAKASSSTKAFEEEISEFGEWFISKKFDEFWAVNQLEEALKITRWAEPDRQVVEYLAEIAPRMPLIVVRCLSLMTDNERPMWYLNAWGQSTRTILSTAISSKDSAAKEAARDEIDRLGARGYLGFRDLLSR